MTNRMAWLISVLLLAAAAYAGGNAGDEILLSGAESAPLPVEVAALAADGGEHAFTFEVVGVAVRESAPFELAVCAGAPCSDEGAVPVERYGFFPALMNGESRMFDLVMSADTADMVHYVSLEPYETEPGLETQVIVRNFRAEK